MKTGFLITARLKSSRLKNKILLDLNGETILDHVISRCKKVVGIDDVVLCTSTNNQDSILFDFALRHRIKFYAGSEDDVLKRLLNAAEYYHIDSFLSITADNPLHSFHIARLMLDSYKSKPADFIYATGVPIGIAPYLIDTIAVKIAVKMKQNSDTEIWGPFINRPDFFNVREFSIKNSPFNKDYRLTCDYLNDYKLIRKIVNYYESNKYLSIQEIFEVMENNEPFWSINNKIKQTLVKQEVLKKIDRHFNQMKEKGNKFAKQLNKKLISGFEQIIIDLY
ncbi:MAG: NTP transferase domain-containing protein [Bacteroidales bacterium]|nr:NTP transferase domain-containing protein [Bacteroidales bacterium]